jgi:hypothetical protein
MYRDRSCRGFEPGLLECQSAVVTTNIAVFHLASITATLTQIHFATVCEAFVS